ncbi:glycosyltransferase [Vibrio parahaemolyticus]|nr:glycosyltransferase [Vibrio parahaemolyticus]
MKNIVAFVGETFQYYDGRHYSKPTSVAFLQDTFGVDKIYAASPAIKTNACPSDFSSAIDSEKFYEFPAYKSTKEFFLNTITKKGYLKSYIDKADEVISDNSGEFFWIRSPSIGSIVFGLRVLKANQVLLHHMCADASNTWKDSKYTGISKAFAFFASRVIRYLLKKICSHPNTINFCTGDVLESFSKKYSPNTYQFVDVMVKDNNIEAYSTPKMEHLRKKLLFVGRMVEDKGIFDLIDVVGQLKNSFTLKLVGDGPDLERARDLVKSLGLEDTIKFTGQLPHAHLAELFYYSDVVTVPSNNNYEGFPRVIMEAWSFGKPVVVSNVGGINAFVVHGCNGLIIKPGDRKDLKNKLEACLNIDSYQKLQIGAESMSEKSLQKYWSKLLLSTVEKYSNVS